MWDLVDNEKSIGLIEAFFGSGRPVAAVCHAPAVLHRATHKGEPLVKGRRVTGFANSEEEISRPSPRSCPSWSRTSCGGWAGFTRRRPTGPTSRSTDGHLVTGQNPASSGSGARKLLQLLQA